MSDVANPFVLRRRVEFHDTDMAGIVHFAAYFRFMEAAEHAFLRHLGLNVFLKDDQGDISWPRVSAGCDFRSPARFSDELAIEVAVEKLGDKSVTYRFRILRDESLLAEGHMTSVCCRVRPGMPPEPISIPPDLRAKLATGQAGV